MMTWLTPYLQVHPPNGCIDRRHFGGVPCASVPQPLRLRELHGRCSGRPGKQMPGAGDAGPLRRLQGSHLRCMPQTTHCCTCCGLW